MFYKNADIMEKKSQKLNERQSATRRNTRFWDQVQLLCSVRQWSFSCSCIIFLVSLLRSSYKHICNISNSSCSPLYVEQNHHPSSYTLQKLSHSNPQTIPPSFEFCSGCKNIVDEEWVQLHRMWWWLRACETFWFPKGWQAAAGPMKEAAALGR